MGVEETKTLRGLFAELEELVEGMESFWSASYMDLAPNSDFSDEWDSARRAKMIVAEVKSLIGFDGQAEQETQAKIEEAEERGR